MNECVRLTAPTPTCTVRLLYRPTVPIGADTPLPCPRNEQNPGSLCSLPRRVMPPRRQKVAQSGDATHYARRALSTASPSCLRRATPKKTEKTKKQKTKKLIATLQAWLHASRRGVVPSRHGRATPPPILPARPTPRELPLPLTCARTCTSASRRARCPRWPSASR
jgi:hypothetical protein